VQHVEAALRGRRTLTKTHRLMLREMSFAHLSPSEIARGMAELRALVDRPILVMPHVAVRLADGAMLGERLGHIEKVLTAARKAGLPTLDPRAFVERDGQERAMDNGGADSHHYAKHYLPTVGSEIVQALELRG